MQSFLFTLYSYLMPSVNTSQKNTRNILVLDDDLEDHFILRLALKDIGETVNLTECCYFSDAINKLETSALIPDMMIIDMQLIRTSGIECLIIIKKDERYSRIPVLMYSGMHTATQDEQAREHGAFAFIEKAGDFNSFCIQLKKAFSILDKGVM